MKKLKLNLDNLKVESFETNSIQSKFGTVVGQQLPPADTNGCPGTSADTLDVMACVWTDGAN
ncbi:MAG: pinensin family lanthipeptide, partial [Melioribacteraceae bacterium]